MTPTVKMPGQYFLTEYGWEAGMRVLPWNELTEQLYGNEPLTLHASPYIEGVLCIKLGGVLYNAFSGTFLYALTAPTLKDFC